MRAEEVQDFRILILAHVPWSHAVLQLRIESLTAADLPGIIIQHHATYGRLLQTSFHRLNSYMACAEE